MTDQKNLTLCHLNDIPDPGGKGFTIEQDGQSREIFVIRKGSEVYGYVNCCPHTGVCLDWQPDQFLTRDKCLIVCSMHGARFRIEDGYCVAGPCAGDALDQVKLSQQDGRIVVENDHR